MPTTDRRNGTNDSAANVQVLVLPERRDDDFGIYRSEVESLPKLLRHHGLASDFAHPTELRRWRVLEGPTEVSFGLAVASSLVASVSWDAFKTAMAVWIRGLGRTPLSIDLRLSYPDGAEHELQINGKGVDVLQALDRIPDIIQNAQ